VAESSWPTASGGGVVGTTWEQMAVNFFADGLHGLPSQPPLVYADSTGRQVKLLANRPGSVRGFTWVTDAILTKSVTANTTGGTTRIDRVVLGLNRSGAWPVTAYVKAGTAATSNPQPPALTQNPTLGGTGIFEISMAKVGPLATGYTTIAPTDVKPEAWYLGPPSITATVDTMPAVATAGLRVYQTDTGKTLIGNGTKFVTGIEDTGYITVPPASSWSTGAKMRRINGEVTMTGGFTRAAGAGVASRTEVNLASIPLGWRPALDFTWGGYLNGSNLVLGLIAASGSMTINFHEAAIPGGASVTPIGLTWPVG
jgi:hypothetical protein